MLPTGRSRKLSTSVPLRWGIGANRLCPRAASIPPPSFRRRSAALGHPRPHGSDRPCACTVPPPGRAMGAPFLRTAGAAQGRPPWRGGSRRPERVVRHGGGQAAPSGGPRLRLVAFVSSPPAWRAVCRAPRLPVPRPSSALWSVVRPRGFGLLGGRGCAPLWRAAPSVGFRSLRLLPPPPLSPGCAWRRLPPPHL